MLPHPRAHVRRRVTAPWSIPLAIVAVVSCGDGASTTEPPDTDPQPEPASVVLNTNDVELNGLSATLQLSAQVRSDRNTPMSGVAVSWSTASSAVATVSASGLVTATGVGETQVIASAAGFADTAQVAVRQVATSLAITPDAVTADSVGERVTLSAQVLDAGGTPMTAGELVWGTSDAAVVAVSYDGIAEVRGAGTAYVRVSMLDGALADSVLATVAVVDLAGIAGPAGATLTGADGAVVIDVPTGALTQDVAITVTPMDDGSVFGGTAYEFGPDGLSFLEPVDLRLRYDPAALGGADPQSLGIYRWTNGAWAEVDAIGVDTVAQEVVGTISGFSRYALRANRVGNASGQWRVVEETGFDTCYDEVGLIEQYLVYVEQSGDQITVETADGPVTGTVVGGRFGWTTSYVFEGVDVTETYAITIDRSGVHATGTGRIVGSGAASCEIRTTIEAEWIGSEQPPASAAAIDSLVLRFASPQPPAATVHEWQPETGESAAVEAIAYAGGATLDGLTAYLTYGEALVLEDAPASLLTGASASLAPGLVGETSIEAHIVTDDFQVVRSRPITLTLQRDTTLVTLVAPGDHGRFFDRSPVLAWSDPNAEVDTWRVGQGDGRVALSTRRAECSVDAQYCTAYAHGFWDAVGGPTTAFTVLEGVNRLGNVVSSGRYDFSEGVPASVSVSTTLPLFSFAGYGVSPGALDTDDFPKDKPFCWGAEGCVEAYRQDANDHWVIVIESRPTDAADLQFARFFIPKTAFGAESSFTVPWDCRTTNPAERAVPNFRWLDEAGASRTLFVDPNAGADGEVPACSGSLGVEIVDYQDARGAWRIFRISGTGTLISDDGARDVSFETTAPIRWSAGDVVPAASLRTEHERMTR